MIELTPEIKEEFKTQARLVHPREACGLLAVIKGKQKYFPCSNIAQDSHDFAISPAEYIDIEDIVVPQAGDIMAVIHSHPFGSAKPSPADRASCEVSGLEWIIYSSKFDDWHSFAPTGYRAPLIGRQFKHGIFDCYSALRDWYAEKLSIVVKDFDRDDKWWEKGQNLFMENFESAGFKQVLDGSIEVGDVFLMNIACPVVNHCAIYIGNDQVFHQTMNRLSSREIYGGTLKKNTRAVLRYMK